MTLVVPTLSSSTCEYCFFIFRDRLSVWLTGSSLFSLEIFALFMLTGIFSTLLIPETKGKSLEELSGEDQEGFVRGQMTE